MNKLFTYINNASANKQKIVFCPYKVKYLNILNWLEIKGFIYSYKIISENINTKNFSTKIIQIKLKYYKNKPLGVLVNMNNSSNPLYHKAKEYKKKPQLQKNLLCISDSSGLINRDQSLLLNKGGRFLFHIKIFDKNIDG